MAGTIVTSLEFVPLKSSLRLTSNAVSKSVDIGLEKSKNFGKFNNALGRITGKASEFNKSLDAATARVFAFGATVSVLNSIRNAFSQLVQVTIEVNRRLTEVKSVIGASEVEFRALAAAIFDVGVKTNQSFKSVADGAVELARQGLSAAENAERLEAALVLTNVSGLAAGKSVKTLTATINGFSDSAFTAAEVVNKLAAVDTSFAVSIDSLADGLSRAGSTAQDAGLSLEELLGIITAVEQRTARGGAVIGNAIKTILPRLSRSGTIDQLRELGVVIDESQDGLEKLQAIAKAVKDLSGTAKENQIFELAAGVRQINIFSAAIKDLNSNDPVIFQAIKTAMEESNNAFEKNAQLVDTLAGKLNSLKLIFTEVGASIGDNLVAPIIDIINNIGSRIGQSLKFIFGDEAKSGVQAAAQVLGETFLNAFRNIIIGPGSVIAIGALLKILLLISKFAKEGFKEVFKIGEAQDRSQRLLDGTNQLLRQQDDLFSAIIHDNLTIEQKSKLILDSIIKQNQVLNIQKETVKDIANYLNASGLDFKEGLFITGKTGRRRAAAGYNADAALEVLEARSLGASAGVKAKLSKGTIGGRRFIMNNQETEITNFGRNGDSAVIPHYGKGFIPNFASPLSLFGRISRGVESAALLGQVEKDILEGLSSGKLKSSGVLGQVGSLIGNKTVGESAQRIVAAAKNVAAQAAITRAALPEGSRKRKQRFEESGADAPFRVNVNDILKGKMPTMLSSSGSGKIDLGIRTGDKNQIPSLLTANKNQEFLFAFDAFNPQFGTEKIKKQYNKVVDADSLYDDILLNRILPFAKSVFSTNINPNNINSKSLKKGVSDLIGRTFEQSFQAGIQNNTRNSSTQGDFDVRIPKNSQSEDVLRSLFGEQSLPTAGSVLRSDFKLTADKRSAISMAGKVLREEEFFNDILRFANPKKAGDKTLFAKSKKQLDRKRAASGFIPELDAQLAQSLSGSIPNNLSNGSQALANAISRERGAGIPRSKIRVGSDSKLINKTNPFGLGVTNTLDEPRGLRDVFAKGFIPNFAQTPSSSGGVDFSKQLAKLIPFPGYRQEMEKFLSSVAAGTIAFDEIEDVLNDVAKKYGKYERGFLEEGVAFATEQQRNPKNLPALPSDLRNQSRISAAGRNIILQPEKVSLINRAGKGIVSATRATGRGIKNTGIGIKNAGIGIKNAGAGAFDKLQNANLGTRIAIGAGASFLTTQLGQLSEDKFNKDNEKAIESYKQSIEKLNRELLSLERNSPEFKETTASIEKLEGELKKTETASEKVTRTISTITSVAFNAITFSNELLPLISKLGRGGLTASRGLLTLIGTFPNFSLAVGAATLALVVATKRAAEANKIFDNLETSAEKGDSNILFFRSRTNQQLKDAGLSREAIAEIAKNAIFPEEIQKAKAFTKALGDLDALGADATAEEFAKLEKTLLTLIPEFKEAFSDENIARRDLEEVLRRQIGTYKEVTEKYAQSIETVTSLLGNLNSSSIGIVNSFTNLSGAGDGLASILNTSARIAQLNLKQRENDAKFRTALSTEGSVNIFTELFRNQRLNELKGQDSPTLSGILSDEILNPNKIATALEAVFRATGISGVAALLEKEEKTLKEIVEASQKDAETGENTKENLLKDFQSLKDTIYSALQTSVEIRLQKLSDLTTQANQSREKLKELAARNLELTKSLPNDLAGAISGDKSLPTVETLNKVRQLAEAIKDGVISSNERGSIDSLLDEDVKRLFESNANVVATIIKQVLGGKGGNVFSPEAFGNLVGGVSARGSSFKDLQDKALETIGANRSQQFLRALGNVQSIVNTDSPEFTKAIQELLIQGKGLSVLSADFAKFFNDFSILLVESNNLISGSGKEKSPVANAGKQDREGLTIADQMALLRKNFEPLAKELQNTTDTLKGFRSIIPNNPALRGLGTSLDKMLTSVTVFGSNLETVNKGGNITETFAAINEFANLIKSINIQDLIRDVNDIKGRLGL